MQHPSATVSASPPVMDDSIPVAVGPSSPETINFIRSRDKRKRKRPDKVQIVKAPKPRPPPKVKVEDEDVCFICFDGGSLVLCDRKGCPKAYHPACIKRDEAFFESTAKWYCGWHICSVCLKASHNMCYTCTYSLCKGCAKDADYFSVRGNMGFCTTCMKTIMLIENKDQANKELVQVDFDDKGSWEYLFKVYWILLKESLALTLDELTKAKNPCKGLTSMACRQKLPDTQHVNHSNGFISNVPHEHLKLVKPMEHVISTERASNVNGASFIGPMEWASKELLELVAHMQNGDTSVLSQLDVQMLLLEYVKKNNLRDPHWDSKINCDWRLKSLFGKPCVGHIEMLKLLEFHFSVKKDSEKNAFIPAGTAGFATSLLGGDDNNENSLLINKNKRQKTQNQVEERGPQNNVDEHAASGLSDQEDVRSGPEIPSATLATEGSLSPSDNETDQLWYYRDPNGNIQGPFSIIQLRKWSTTGLFPPDMRIWTIDEQDDSVLLTDAINSSFQSAAHLLYNFSLLAGAATSSSRNQNVGDLQSNNTNEFVRSDGFASISSGSTTSVVSEKDMQPGTSQHSELKDNNSSSDRSQVCQPPPSSSVEPENVALSHEGQDRDHASEGSRPSPHHDNQVSLGAADPISDVHNENQSNGKSYLRQSSGQNWRPFPINLNLNDVDTNCGFSPATMSDKFEHDSDVDLPELPKDGNQESSGLAAEKLQPVSSDVPAQISDVRYLPRPTPKPTIDEDQRGPNADSKPPPAAKANGQDLGPSWGTDSTLVVGGVNREIADEWGRFSPTLAKPSVDDWSSGLVSVLSLKQPEVGSDHADPLARTSPADPTSNNNNSCWQSVVETIEFTTLAEESVSDLLAEVDAMESQCGLGSPTSAMKFRDERMKSCKNDYCFTIGDLSPSPDPGKSDALSSTGDIQFLFDEPVGASRAFPYDTLKHSRGHSSTSSEGETKAANIPPTKQREAGSAVHPRSSRPMSLDITDTSMPGNNGLTALDTFWGREPGHVNLDWGAPAERNLNIDWGKSQQAPGANLNFDQGASTGGVVWDGQHKYSGERYNGPIDWGQGGGTGYSKGRPFWNRQPFESDGGYSRPPPKGQRVCKYYESGRCKKGALCNYLHP